MSRRARDLILPAVFFLLAMFLSSAGAEEVLVIGRSKEALPAGWVEPRFNGCFGGQGGYIRNEAGTIWIAYSSGEQALFTYRTDIDRATVLSREPVFGQACVRYQLPGRRDVVYLAFPERNSAISMTVLKEGVESPGWTPSINDPALEPKQIPELLAKAEAIVRTALAVVPAGE